MAGHVEEVLLPLIAALGEHAGAGRLLPRRDDGAGGRGASGAPAVAAIAAPWRFSAFPDEARALLARLWAGAAPTSEALGCLPMEVLQSAFWSLDPARTVAKFEAYADMAEGSAEARAFVTLEDWANDGPPLPHAAAKELFEDLFGARRHRARRVAARRSGRPPLPVARHRLDHRPDRPGGDARRARASGSSWRRAMSGWSSAAGRRQALWEPLAAWLSRHATRC